MSDKQHDQIVQEVLNLNKIQNVKKPSRTEPSLIISEFNLVKSVTGDKGSVHLNTLTKVLKGRKKHDVISKKIQQTNSKSKTLPAPLEKPQAERIRRSINYEKSRLELDRWEALITSNRVAPQLRFPLNSTEKLKVELKRSETYPSTWRIKSDLQKELEKLEGNVEEYRINQEKETFPLTLNELKERRKEAAKLRAHQSYKEAKARRQNKIKSKKYHRILRREKIKQKLKEFEELQKTNPEEALKKLEDIERARAEERFSLRHKGTGQWAKNKQIRAKYDKESRQVLAQQLSISRDLTQKLKNVDSDSETEGADVEEKSNQNKDNVDNPWVSSINPSKEVADFVSGYRKYWTERNVDSDNIKENNNGCSNNDIDESAINEKAIEEKEIETKESKKGSKAIEVNKEVKLNKSVNNGRINKRKVTIKKKIKSNEKDSSGTSWEVSLLENGNDVEDIFNKLEEKLEEKLSEKYRNIEQSPEINNGKSRNKKTKIKKVDLTLPIQKKRPIIDEPMIEEPGNRNMETEEITAENPALNINRLKNIIDSAVVKEKPSDIDPQKFVQVKPTNLSTAIPDIFTTEDNEETNNQRDVILEAFEDDDIAEDFKKEKESEVKKDTPGDIDLNLPGWGSWGGTNIAPRKRRRFIIKMPRKVPRKDDNKGSLIINEKAQSKIKPHMVSELPFPFKTVKDYEASIRAPIGNTFVPETAFRKFIEPSVITKMGAIIEPITKSVLTGGKKY